MGGQEKIQKAAANRHRQEHHRHQQSGFLFGGQRYFGALCGKRRRGIGIHRLIGIAYGCMTQGTKSGGFVQLHTAVDTIGHETTSFNGSGCSQCGLRRQL